MGHLQQKGEMGVGKVAVVSGGTRGIGRAIVEKFAKEGVNVAFTYYSNRELAEQLAEELGEKYQVQVKTYPLNVLEPEQYRELFPKIAEDFGRVDIFISNAIITGRPVVGGFGPFMRLRPRGLCNIFTATVTAFIIGTQEAVKQMEKVGGGVVISLSSTGNLVYTPNYTGHGIAKAGVEVAVKYAAAELGEKNIRVNAVSGAPIETDALKAFPNFEEIKAEVENRSPLGRIGRPEDLAGLIYFLTTDEASWITGQTFIIDGGTTFGVKR
jgi:7-alpha-hydroxysteroid dehydrogenase